MIKAIAWLVIGGAMLFLGFIGRQFFWAKPFFAGTREAPLWLGRAVSIFVGLGFMILGIRYFFLGY